MNALKTGGVHHVVLTVSDVKCSVDFYTRILDFRINAGSIEDNQVFLVNGNVALGIGLPHDPDQCPENDQFNEHRMGLDHLSLSVDSLDMLEFACQTFDVNGVPHGDIEDMRPYGFPVFVLPFRDPDNIQLELTVPATT